MTLWRWLSWILALWDGSGDMAKFSVAGHRWQRARAALKVGLGLGYQAAARQGKGSECCSWWAARVTRENKPSRTGVVRAMARSDHWRRGAAAVERVQSGVGAVVHHHQVAVGQPTAQLQDHLPGPISELLGLASPIRVVGFRGRRDGAEGQGPHPAHPGNGTQPHQGYPAQTDGLDHMAPMGTGRVAVGPFGRDARSSAALRGFVDAEHQGAATGPQVLQQQPHSRMPAARRGDHTARLSASWQRA